MIDDNGNKWVGTEGGGLAKFDGTTWMVYSSFNSGLPDNNISSIAIDGSGNKWIGTEDSGLAKFDGIAWTVYTTSNSGLSDNNVSSLGIDGNGTKWIGTEDGGLAKFNGMIWTVYTTSNSGLPENSVSSVIIDGIGSVWVGTLDAGFAKFDGAAWKVYTSSNSGLPDDWIQTLLIDGNGNLFIGTAYGGLAVFSCGVPAKIKHKAELNPITSICRNYPNPFKQKTFINYNVLEYGPVCLRIYALDGHLVQTMVNEKQTIGHYVVSWDGLNNKGKIMARGVYLYQLITNSGMISNKMNFVE